MAGGVAGPGAEGVMRRGRTLWLTVMLAATVAAWAQRANGQDKPALAPVPKECLAPAAAVVAGLPLPNIAVALKERKKITILAIGGTSASLRGPVSGGHYAIVERFLESTFKGLDVVVVHRGVSGELASHAAERIRIEVALTGADLLLWQLGTADALARVPPAEFHESVSQTIAWLKRHKIDVVLVGLRYARSMANDAHYQAIRAAIQAVGKEHNVLRIGRYDAEETLARIRAEQGVTISEAEVTEVGYSCMAEHLARAIASGLFVTGAPPKAPPGRKEP